MSENHDDAAVFFCRYEVGNASSAYKENTVFIYDSPYWQEDTDDEEEDDDSPNAKEQLLTLSALRSKLEGLTCQVKCSSLSIEEAGTWNDIDEPTLADFCKGIRDLLPNVTTVDIEEPHNMGDEKLKHLLWHLPTRANKLSLESSGGDLPLTYRCLGTCLIPLEDLLLCGCGPRTQGGSTFSKTSGTNLALSLSQLPRLRTLAIANFLTEEKATSWEPVFRALCNNPRLECVNFAGGHYRVPGGYCEFHPNTTTMQGIQYGPLLNRIKNPFLAAEAVELRDFVLALIAGRDRIDVLDNLLSTTDPNLYAWPAIGEQQPSR